MDDSLTLCPTMYNRVFIWPKTRAKSELRVRLVPLDMLFVLLAQISSIVFLNAKNLAFTPYCGVCVVGGGGQDVITIQTSTMTPLSATVSRVDRCWRVGQWLQMHFTLTTRVGICVRLMEQWK